MPATLNRTPVMRRFVKRYMPEHLLTYGIGLVFLFATTAVIITIPKIIGQMIDQLRLPEATFTTVQPTIVRLMLLAGLLFLFRAISRVVIFFPGRKIEQSLRQTFFNRLTMLPRRDTERFSIGDLMSRGVNDISAVRVMVSMGILHVINTAVLFTGAVHGMASLSPQLTAWVVVPILAMPNAQSQTVVKSKVVWPRVAAVLAAVAVVVLPFFAQRLLSGSQGVALPPAQQPLADSQRPRASSR